MKPESRKYTINNERKLCKHPGCQNHRFGMGVFCKSHRYLAENRRMYGWYEGHKIRKNTLDPYRKAVKDLVARNLSHEAIRSSIQFFDNWIENASMGLSVPLIDEMSGLRERGVTGTDIIIECAAIVHLAYLQPSHLPPERIPLTLAIGRAILQLGWNRQIKSMVPVRIAGNKAFDEVGGVLLRIHRELTSREANEREKKAKMDKPFDWEG